ncbi:hypothetical protein AOT14_04940 [Stenotrophomonas acidaminiphila]|uniref:Uncharacterized protein n=1 Tax=Stenotrophomonas acidaminiphila TaxID=128780 RepID=A0A0S1AW25_9GAMM|nr:hypothetical protein AOT14_04940 [Stenotrophomonas acidaminiphila]
MIYGAGHINGQSSPDTPSAKSTLLAGSIRSQVDSERALHSPSKLMAWPPARSHRAQL